MHEQFHDLFLQFLINKIPKKLNLPHFNFLSEDQISLLLKDLHVYHGYDFNYYSRDSLNRRINKIFRLEKFGDFTEFRKKIKTDAQYIEHFIDRVMVNVTEMFRDHNFFAQIKNTVIPALN